MLFGTPRNADREAITPRLKKQFLYQAILLLLAIGLLITLWSRVERQDRELRGQVAVPDSEPEPLVPGLDGEADIDNVDLASLEPPEPWFENRDILSHAAVLEAKGELDSEAVVHLLHKVRSIEGGLASIDPVLSEVRGDQVWAELNAAPHKYRGKLVEVRGNLIASPNLPAVSIDAEVDLPTPNPAGVPGLHRAYVYGEDSRFYVINLIDAAPERVHMDGVLFRGYFVQLYTYDLELNDRLRRAKIPLLVGDSLTYVPGPEFEPVDMTPLYVIVLSLPLIAGVVIFIVSFRSKRPRHERAPRRGFPSGGQADS